MSYTVMSNSKCATLTETSNFRGLNFSNTLTSSQYTTPTNVNLLKVLCNLYTFTSSKMDQVFLELPRVTNK